jgi:hypothetical protein
VLQELDALGKVGLAPRYLEDAMRLAAVFRAIPA